jgi:hypothetical protein
LELGTVADEAAEIVADSGSSSKIIRSASGSFFVATVAAGFAVEEAAEVVDVLDFAAEAVDFDVVEVEELVDFVEDLAEATVEFTVLADF